MAVSTIRTQMPYVVKSTASEEVTIGAGATISVTQTATLDGYTPIGIVGVNKTGASSGLVAVSRFWIASGNAYIALVNTSSASRTVTVSAHVLYQKN